MSHPKALTGSAWGLPAPLRPHTLSSNPTSCQFHPLVPSLPTLELSWEGCGKGRAGPLPFCSLGLLCRLELVALERVVRISAKPTKRLHEALQPILAKHGLSLEQVALHRVSQGSADQGHLLGGREPVTYSESCCPLPIAR